MATISGSLFVGLPQFAEDLDRTADRGLYHYQRGESWHGPGLGRLGARTFAFYFVTTLIATLIALAVINVVQPGIINGQPARELLALHTAKAEVLTSVNDRASGGVLSVLSRIVPGNIVAAAAENKILGVVVFSVLFGFFLARIADPQRSTVMSFWKGAFRRHRSWG